MNVPRKWIDRVREHGAFDKLILDQNNSVSETYGRQERAGSAVARERRLQDKRYSPPSPIFG